jgi:hypothetical protein
MKNAVMIAAMVCLLSAGVAVAQEHWTEGPVWAVSFYRTTPGHFDDYMKYLRTHYIATTAEAKKQGLILDTMVFVKTPVDANDWDVAIATLSPSYAKALDFNQADDAKGKAIQAQHWKTPDQEKQREMTNPRFEMRKALGTTYTREVTLRPLP